MNKLVLYHHLGLGDHFVCNGLVHKFAEDWDKIYLPCKQHNYDTVEYLYSESPKVEVVSISGNEYEQVYDLGLSLDIPVLSVGFKNSSYGVDWDISFYRQVDIDFSERYNSFRTPQKPPKFVINTPDEPFILVHDVSSVSQYNLNVDTKYKIVKFEKGVSSNLFSYIDLIRNAIEIHCIDSSVYHLIDSLTGITDKLFYHHVRNAYGQKTRLLSKWEEVYYDGNNK
tara:strand:- start:1133 stop:1810 length:678 start_codon:yes stop_codon:yes gene_type:complete